MPAPTDQLARTSQAYDAATSFGVGRATISVTTATTGFAFPLIADQEYKVQISHATYADYVPSTSEWGATVEVATLPAGPWVAVGNTVLPGGGGMSDIPLSGRSIQQALPTAAFVRLNLIKVGITAAALSYDACIVPV